MNKFLVLLFITSLSAQFRLPIDVQDVTNIDQLHLTEIGEFALIRKARPKVKEHYHTGIDIARPSSNYQDELIYPISKGKVISKRTDGPYAQLIIEHQLQERTIWTLYEHIAGVSVALGETVNPNHAIARFMNKSELDKHGWQFDHFHFEILKVKPYRIKAPKHTPNRHYSAYTLICYSINHLQKYYYNPINFFQRYLSE